MAFPLRETFMVFLVCVVLCELAAGRCPATKTGVNCSFDTANSCVEQYHKMDNHGLKWNIHNGLIVGSFNTLTQGRRYRLPTILQHSPEGQYLYMRGTSDTRAHGLWTDLVSPPVTVGSTGCLYFLFHNNVCGNESDASEIAFKVLLRPDERQRVGIQNDIDDILLMEYPCIDSNEWYNTRIPVIGHTGKYRVVFSAKQHGNVDQIVAVDGVIYSDISCSILDDSVFTVGDCDFEEPNLCGYTRSKDIDTPLEWRLVLRQMVAGKKVQIASSPGFLLALWGKDKRKGPNIAHAKIRVESPQIDMRDKGCLSITYYNGRYFHQNDDAIALVVSKENGSHSNEILYELPATLGNAPIKAFINLPVGQYSVRFTASVKPPYGVIPTDFIALDDIEIHQSSCDDIHCQSEVCETLVSLGGVCNSRGRCVGRGLKHFACDCDMQYIGKSCEFNDTERNPKFGQGWWGVQK